MKVAELLLHLGLLVEEVVSLGGPGLEVVDLVVELFHFDGVLLVDLADLILVVLLHLLIVLL